MSELGSDFKSILARGKGHSVLTEGMAWATAQGQVAAWCVGSTCSLDSLWAWPRKQAPCREALLSSWGPCRWRSSKVGRLESWLRGYCYVPLANTWATEKILGACAILPGSTWTRVLPLAWAGPLTALWALVSSVKELKWLHFEWCRTKQQA